MKRRKFIQLTGIGAAAVPVSGSLASGKSAKRFFQTSPDVVVLGAGTLGAWTAYHLNEIGANVTLVDPYGPANSRASSGGETRLIQIDNDNPVYVRSGIRAFELWKKLELEVGTSLVLPTGRLAMSGKESYLKDAQKRQSEWKEFGITNSEILAQDEIRKRWPQIYSDDIKYAMFTDGGPAGSTLMARRGIQSVANLFQKRGGSLRIAKAMPIMKDGKIEGVNLDGKETLRAEHYVFACGPWLTKIFPELLLPKLDVQRRDVLFVGTPPGDSRFSHPNLPEWSISGSGYYGFPDIEGRGLKVAPYPDNNVIDPDNDERLISLYQTKRTHDFVKKRFPDLSNQPIIESRVCQVTNSSDGDFIVDNYPGSGQAWIMGAGSGHAFKHGPAVGEYAAKRILNGESDSAFDSTFRLNKA